MKRGCVDMRVVIHTGTMKQNDYSGNFTA